MTSETLKKIKQDKLVAIARKIPYEQITKVAEAIYKGGGTLIEVTFDQGREDCIHETQKCISAICQAMGEKMLIGAGTVLNIEQARAASEAGAKYILSPNTNIEVIKETKSLGMVSIPGAMTPTEITTAWAAGADIVKLFPADDLGYHYIKNILSPLCHIPILATGGVNPETIPEFHAAGIIAFGTGCTIMKPELIREENYTEITHLARLHSNAVQKLK